MVAHVSFRLRDAFAWILGSLLVVACSSDEGDSSSVGEGTGGAVSVTGGGPGVVVGGMVGTGAIGSGAMGGAGDGCARAGCGPGQRCEVLNGKAECIDKTCDELDC